MRPCWIYYWVQGWLTTKGRSMEREIHFAQELLRILYEGNVIDKDKARNIGNLFEHRTKIRFEDFIFSEGFISKKDYLNALSKYFKVPAFDCVGYFFKTNLLHKFPKGMLLRNVCIPVEVDQNMLIMVANDPEKPDLLPKIGEHVSYDVRFMVGIAHDITDAVKEFYERSETAIQSDRRDYEQEQDAEIIDRDPSNK